MIERIKNNLSRVERSPYLNYGSISYRFKNQNETASSKSEIQNENVDKNFSNPFEEKPKNIYQQEFDENYRKIAAFVNDVKFNLSQKGKIQSFINDVSIDTGAVVSRYLYDESLPKSENYVVENKNRIKKYDKKGNKILETQIKNGDISTLMLFGENYDQTILFWDRNMLDRFFKNNKLTQKQYQKFDKNGNLVEQANFAKNGKCTRFIKINGDTVEEVLFDSEQNYQNSSFVPIQYNLYKNETKIKSLKYAYSRPIQYKEYDETTSKITKVFNLQGLKSNVCKYTFYSSLNGNLIASGNV